MEEIKAYRVTNGEYLSLPFKTHDDARRHLQEIRVTPDAWIEYWNANGEWVKCTENFWLFDQPIIDPNLFSITNERLYTTTTTSSSSWDTGTTSWITYSV